MLPRLLEKIAGRREKLSSFPGICYKSTTQLKRVTCAKVLKKKKTQKRKLRMQLREMRYVDLRVQVSDGSLDTIKVQFFWEKFEVSFFGTTLVANRSVILHRTAQ